MSCFSKWDREGYRRRVGEEEAARRRRSIMAEQWGYQLAEERKRLGFTQAGLAEIMGVSTGRVTQIEHGEAATVEALAAYVSALGGKLELLADIGGHLLKMPTDPPRREMTASDSGQHRCTRVLLPVAHSRCDDQGHQIVAAITSSGSPITMA